MDVHNTCLVVALLSLSVSAVVIFLSCLRHTDDNPSSRHEAKIKIMLRDLQTFQNHTPQTTEHGPELQSASFYNLRQRLKQDLGNYFTRGYFIHRDKYHQEYTHSSLAILPFFQDDGGHFETCLLKMALAHNHAVSPKMTLWNRLKWDTSSEGVFRFKHKFKVHYGKASFGACSKESENDAGVRHYFGDNGGTGYKHNKGTSGHRVAAAGSTRCGHAFIMQDPIALAIADLADCLLDPRGKSICQIADQNKSTVEEWVAARGNIVFRNILFNSNICQNRTYSQNTQHHTFSQKNSSHAAGYLSHHELCEGNHGKFIDGLDPNVVGHLVNFIVRNIQNLFSVVGIFEDFRNSLAILNQVFRFPLHECEFLSRFRETSSESKSKHVPRMRSALVQDSSLNDIKSDSFESSQYENMPSLSRSLIKSPEDVTFLDALSHIENSKVWRNDVRTSTTASQAVTEGHQNSDIVFDYEEVDTNSSENNNHVFSDLKVDESNSESTLSNNTHTSSDITSSVGDSSLYFRNVSYKTGSLHSDVSEDDREEDDNISPVDVLSDNILPFRSEQLKIDAVIARLYRRFMDSETIRQSLAADLQIYDAVKKLYFAQKQLFFNSIKPI